MSGSFSSGFSSGIGIGLRAREAQDSRDQFARTAAQQDRQLDQADERIDLSRENARQYGRQLDMAESSANYTREQEGLERFGDVYASIRYDGTTGKRRSIEAMIEDPRFIPAFEEAFRDGRLDKFVRDGVRPGMHRRIDKAFFNPDTREIGFVVSHVDKDGQAVSTGPMSFGGVPIGQDGFEPQTMSSSQLLGALDFMAYKGSKNFQKVQATAEGVQRLDLNIAAADKFHAGAAPPQQQQQQPQLGQPLDPQDLDWGTPDYIEGGEAAADMIADGENASESKPARLGAGIKPITARSSARDLYNFYEELDKAGVTDREDIPIGLRRQADAGERQRMGDALAPTLFKRPPLLAKTDDARTTAAHLQERLGEYPATDSGTKGDRELTAHDKATLAVIESRRRPSKKQAEASNGVLAKATPGGKMTPRQRGALKDMMRLGAVEPKVGLAALRTGISPDYKAPDKPNVSIQRDGDNWVGINEYGQAVSRGTVSGNRPGDPGVPEPMSPGEVSQSRDNAVREIVAVTSLDEPAADRLFSILHRTPVISRNLDLNSPAEVGAVVRSFGALSKVAKTEPSLWNTVQQYFNEGDPVLSETSLAALAGSQHALGYSPSESAAFISDVLKPLVDSFPEAESEGDRAAALQGLIIAGKVHRQAWRDLPRGMVTDVIGAANDAAKALGEPLTDEMVVMSASEILGLHRAAEQAKR